ncbi:zonadhesin [Nephila pilipes]|uniref:Zonadhesin n=1 Tax=Nephila pilipes TaxID=299642 RepID=A0A8X6TUR5_NEPPI|nr:zonadhesin [Nephila pilipes]
MRPSYCSSMCSDTEEFVDRVNPCNTCDNRGQCTVLEELEPGCDCKVGHYRNREGVCIPEEECEGEPPVIENGSLQRRSRPAQSKKCGIDEEFLECGCLRTCCNGGRDDNCASQCLTGCFCREGLVRNDFGKCVRLEDCNSNDNGGNNVCSGVNEEIVPCAKPKFCNTCGIRGNCKLKSCEEGCDCKAGYYRDNSGICIPESQCPGTQSEICGLNEEFKECGTA